LLAASQRDRFPLASIEIVLVSPRNPLNIGAAARAMANFGFAHLTVVAPYEPHWREARSAVGAEKLLAEAQCTDNLEEAIADCTLVLGTGTLTRRKPEQPVVPLPALAPLIQEELARGGRVALIFGPEKRGLTRGDLTLCHRLVEIPTHPSQPSMNLGQAVAVCLYELATRLANANEQAPGATRPSPPGAPSAGLELLADLIDQVMQAARYSPPSMRETNQHDLRLLLRRVALTPTDVRRALGFFRRILKRLES
jgi:TrmH family RNA methyltransferase